MPDHWTERAPALATEIERDRAEGRAIEGRLDEIIDALRALAVAQARLAAQAEMSEMLLEVKQEELAALRDIFTSITNPVLEVQRDVLCVPLVGPIDAQTMGELMDSLLMKASERRARLLIIDLSAAKLADASSAHSLVTVFRALALLGVRGAISGVNPELALLLAALPEGLGVPAYGTLAAALAATSPFHEGRKR